MKVRVIANRENKKVFLDLEKTPKKIRDGLRSALTEIGRDNVKHGKLLIKNPPKSGRIYKLKGRNHQASAAGESPANRSGRLLRSFRFRVYGWNRMEFGVHAPYGKYLEDGTSKMAARPFLIRTVMEKSRDNFNAIKLAARLGK